MQVILTTELYIYNRPSIDFIFSFYNLSNFLIYFWTVKKTANRSAVFLGEGIFTMGLVKTIYNVLGGFYMDYNSTNTTESVHKLHKSLSVFLCTFPPSKFILSIFNKNMHKKTRFFTPGFVFVNFRTLLCLFFNSFFVEKCLEFFS